MAEVQRLTPTFGDWEIKNTIRDLRVYEVEKDGQKGIAKMGMGVAMEVSILKRLDHPNIIKIIDSDLYAPIPYMVTEYHSGKSLSSGTLSQVNDQKKDHIVQKLINVTRYCAKKGIGLGDNDVILSTDGEPIVIDFEHNQLIEPHDIRYSFLIGIILNTMGSEYLINQLEK